MYGVTELAGQIGGRMLPAYAAIAFGFWIGRFSRKDWLKLVSNLLTYVLIPIVVFRNTSTLAFNEAVGGIGISIAFSVIMIVLAMIVVPRLSTDVPRRLAYCSFGYTNIGWFGIPTGLALFGPSSTPILVMAYVGGLLFGNTVGFYLVARDRFSVKASLIKVATLPAIHAFMAGLLFQFFQIPPDLISSSDTPFRIATMLLSTCGMMVVGLGTSHVTFSWAAIRDALGLVVWRHILSLLAIGIAIGLCGTIGLPIPGESLKVVILIGLLPVAGNLVVFAAQLGSGITSSSLIIAISTTISTITVFCWGVALHLM